MKKNEKFPSKVEVAIAGTFLFLLIASATNKGQKEGMAPTVAIAADYGSADSLKNLRIELTNLNSEIAVLNDQLDRAAVEIERLKSINRHLKFFLKKNITIRFPSVPIIDYNRRDIKIGDVVYFNPENHLGREARDKNDFLFPHIIAKLSRGIYLGEEDGDAIIFCQNGAGIKKPVLEAIPEQGVLILFWDDLPEKM